MLHLRRLAKGCKSLSNYLFEGKLLMLAETHAVIYLQIIYLHI